VFLHADLAGRRGTGTTILPANPAPNQGQRFLASGERPDGKMLNECVGGRSKQALVTVLPADQVRRRATLPEDIYDHPLTVHIAHMAPPDDQFIAGCRSHRVMPPSLFCNVIKFATDGVPVAGPKVRTSKSVHCLLKTPMCAAAPRS